MKSKMLNFVNGEWRSVSDGEVLKVINPAT